MSIHGANQCCGSEDNRPKQALVQLYEKNCDTACGSAIEGCPSDQVPLFGVSIPDFSVTVPEVNKTFDLITCQAYQVTVGLWVYLYGLGRFQIVARNSNGRTLTLRNSCSSGAAVAGNAEPGTNKTGQHVFHPTAPPDCDLGFDEAVKDAVTGMNSANLYCFPNPPLAIDSEKLYLFGLTGACDPGDCPPTEDPNCLKKSPFISFDSNTMNVLEGFKTVDPSIEDEACLIIGPMVEIENGDNGTQLARAVGGMIFFPAGENGDLLIEEQSFDNAGPFESVTYPIQTSPFVPECAKFVELRGWVWLDPDLDGASASIRINCYVTGPTTGNTDVNHKVDYIQVKETSSIGGFTWYKKVQVTEASKLCNLTFQVINSSGDEGTDFKYGVYITGYWM